MATITEPQYQQLKRDAELAKSEAERARGNLEAAMERLKREHDCTSIKEAKAKLKQMEAERDEAQAVFESALDNYKKRWK